jgi:hypothetical protein
VRPSSLGVAEFCPRSADLSEQSGISRSAIISTAWHAKLAGNDTLVGELHPDERKELATWGTPTDAIWMPPGSYADGTAQVLDYESAEKELHVQVLERDTLITEGTLDFAWVREVNGQRWAFVADLKRSTWAIPDGPDCLQLAAYGHAYAVLRSCVGYTPGLWSGTDSEWSWGTPVDLTSPDALDLWLRLKRAARNTAGRFVTGAHCKSCYGRMRCPEWDSLAIDGFSQGVAISEENAAHVLLKADAMIEHAERLKDNIKVFAERGGVVKDTATGKVYLPTLSAGRKSLDQDALKAAGVDVAKFQKVGKPFNTYGWRKA